MITPAVLISATELETLMKSEPVVLIDTRDADTFAAGHIPGSVNLREIFTFLATSTAEGLTELKGTFAQHFGAAGLSGLETAVFYEDALNSGYGQSCRGYYLLTWLGYPKVKVLNGGYSAWKAGGMAITTEVTPVTPATFPTNLTMADVMLTKDEMLAAVTDQSGTAPVLLDVRDIDDVDRRQLVALWQGLRAAQGPHSGCQMAGVVPLHEAVEPGPDDQVARRSEGRSGHRRYIDRRHDLPVLLQGRARVEHLPGIEPRNRS